MESGPLDGSAPPIGHIDWYYWDDLRGVTGLDAAADLATARGDSENAQRFRGERHDFMAGAISRHLREFTPDLLHAHHPFLLGDAALRTARELGRPLVFTHHTMYEDSTH